MKGLKDLVSALKQSSISILKAPRKACNMVPVAGLLPPPHFFLDSSLRRNDGLSILDSCLRRNVNLLVLMPAFAGMIVGASQGKL
jgi:hypothetical protein